MKGSYKVYYSANHSHLVCVSFLVGTHVDFCCHLQRGDTKSRRRAVYEPVKFVLTLRDICSSKWFALLPPNTVQEICSLPLPT